MSSIGTLLTSNNRNVNFLDEIDQNIIERNQGINEGILGIMDDKRNRKAVFRRTIDYNSSITFQQEQRLIRRVYSNRNAIQPDIHYQHLLTPPQDYKDNPMNCVCAKHVRTSTNKNKCPIYTVCWTPDGRRLITAASSGEFTLWNGLTFNFETILQAHDTHIKAMKWSHNEEWLLSGDDLGMVKYWQANMNDVNVFQAHKDSVRGLSFCPSDKKFVTCSVDNTVRIWDFQLYKEERVLRGHSGEVKAVVWHPTKSLVLSGSKDSQQPLKLWDPKSGECISTMYVHKNSINDIAINKNGNWFLSASRDHTIKLFDLRNLKSEMQVFRGHKKDVNRVAWHPFHENLFASGSGDGALMYWMVGTDMEVGSVDDAHDSSIWSIDWHPMGHILASGSNDFATKFWTRNRPGDILKDNQQVDHNGSTAKVPEVTHNSNISEGEVETILKRVKKSTSFEELDLQRLSSSIEADLENMVSDIPGLSGGIVHANEMDTCDEDSEEREAKLKGAGNRIIPKQFVLNWAEKRKTPAGYIFTETAQKLFIPPQPTLVHPPFLNLPPQHIMAPHQPILAPHNQQITQPPQPVCFSAPLPPNFNKTLPEMNQPMTLLPPQHPIKERFQNLPNQQKSSPDFTEHRPNNGFIKIEENEGNNNNNNNNNESPQNRTLNNNNRLAQDEDYRNQGEFRENRRLPPQQPPPPPPHLRGPPRNFHPINPDGPFETQHHFRPPPRHFPQNNINNNNLGGGFESMRGQPRQFRPEHQSFLLPPRQRPIRRDFYENDYEEDFIESPHPPPPHHHPQHQHQQRQFNQNNYDGPFVPQQRQQNQRDFRQYVDDVPFMELRHHPPNQRMPFRNFHPFESQQQQRLPPPPPPSTRDFRQYIAENPFEPQKSTGSSKGFIPLPFNNEEPMNKRNRPPRPGPGW